MLVSDSVSRQGSYRMVISVELATTKGLIIYAPLFQPQTQIQAFTYKDPFEVLLDVCTI